MLSSSGKTQRPSNKKGRWLEMDFLFKEESYYGWFSLHVPWDTPRRELAGQLIVVAEDDK